MSDQTSVFADNDPQATPAQPATQEGGAQQPTQEAAPQPSAEPAAAPQTSDNVFADQLASIKNERGEPKYRSTEEALNALKHSQEYIPTLKQENDTLRSELEQLKAKAEERGNLDEAIERLTSQRQEPASTPEAQGLTPEQVQELLNNTLTEREQQSKALGNQRQVEEALSNQYGEKTKEVVQQKAQELGLTAKKLGELAQESPQMVLTLFNVTSKSSQGKSNSSSVNIPPITPDKSSEAPSPERSLLSGASMSDLTEYMKRNREYVYQRLGVTE